MTQQNSGVGVTPAQMEAKKQEMLNKEKQQAEQSKPNEQQVQAQETPLQDATPQYDERDINTLKSTYGIDIESIPDNAREGILKVAKSYREAQSAFTKTTQEKSELQKQLEEKAQVVSSMDEFFSKNPDVLQTIQQRRNENPTSQKPTQGQSTPTGKLDKQMLIQAGYLTENATQGLDELAQRRVVMEAELDYLRDQKLKEYEQGLTQKETQLAEQRQLATVKQVNEQRKNDGIDRVVSDYGINFTELDSETISAITKRASRILDPSDDSGKTIDADAFYDATIKELALRGKLPQKPIAQSNTQQGTRRLTDTGVSVQGRGIQPLRNSISELLSQKENERKAKLKTTITL
jgi:hypothetical protein